MTATRIQVSQLVACVALLGWLSSLLLAAVDVGPASPRGWQFLLYGWQGLTSFSIGGVSWLANPLFLCSALGTLRTRARRMALPLAAAALLAALTSFLFNLFGDQGGLAIERFLGGFYLWLASIGIQCVAAILQEKRLAGSRSADA